MIRRIVVALALLFAFLVAPASAPAAPFTTAFNALVANLETRRDNDFGGTLDAAKKKQRTAVLKSLTTLAKPSTSLVTDLTHAVTVVGLLEKPYAADFAAKTGLGGLAHNAVVALGSALGEHAYENAGKYSNALGTKLAASTAAINAELLAASTAPYATVKARAQAYLKLHKKYVALAKAVAKEFGKGDLVLWETNVYRRGTTAEVEWYEGDKTLQVFGSHTSASGVLHGFHFLVGGITGPGTYPLSGPLVEGSYTSGIPPNLTDYALNAGSGSLVVELADPVKRRFKGRLSCTFTGGAGPSILAMGDMQFYVKKHVALRTGNGF